MSMSDSESSSSGDYKNLRQITRERLLYEMLRSTRAKDPKAIWKGSILSYLLYMYHISGSPLPCLQCSVIYGDHFASPAFVLIMDKLTTKIMSCACKMADITEEGVSLVEDINKRRQPMLSMDAIYFVQPTKEKVFVFFSSPASRELIHLIKNDGSVLPRMGALSEMNLEYFAIDSQGFITDHERALEDVFGDNAEILQTHNAFIHTMAARIATVFASLREFPYIRYRAAKSSLDASTLTTFRDLIPTKLAAAVWHCLARYKAIIPDFPQTETCEFLIIDRSIDQIAPVIHEWTYDAMCHDLLNMEGNKYVQKVPSKTGSTSEKEVLLEDHDPIWLELRHLHIADASERLHSRMTNFISRNKAAQIHNNSRDGGELSTRDLQKLVQTLPQYSEQLDKLSLHIEIAGKINELIRELGLREIGKLEQDLVFGDAGTKDLISFLKAKQEVTPENKIRLLMIYAAIFPEKFDGDKGEKLMQVS
ncbi:SNARE-interacting protein KEULE isoform X2 [Dendrobium catenatum]|uniref:SNARE-interacting protein KEULE isoform X2 n=1 Tax=Dendrobium catenatum TaxID=906689 RepID=UPI0010A03627|nr:SNARE-interacting protein KEULE isoform X2 [Dendrobium catenatum]